MNILIIDDNAAVREVIKETVFSAGHTVWTADSFEEAAAMAADSRYGAVILDADAGGGRGLEILDAMDGTNGPNVLVIRTPGTAVPTDSISLGGVLDKPFSSHDLLDKIEDMGSAGSDEGKKRQHRSLFRPKEAPPVARPLNEAGLEFGRSYVMFQDNSRAADGAAASFGAAGCDILMISSSKPKVLKEKFKGCSMESVTLEVKSKGEFSDVYRLGTLINQVNEFISRAERPVIVFDSLNQLVNRNGMNPVLMMVNELAAPADKPRTLIISVNAHGFSDKDKSILKNRLEHYVPADTGRKEAR